MGVPCSSNKLRLIDTASGQVTHEVVHGSWVITVAWHPSGTSLATGSCDKKLRLIDAASGQVTREVVHGSWVRDRDARRHQLISTASIFTIY